MNVQRPEILKRIVAERTALVLDEPFYAPLAPRLILKEDRACRTAWTDGRHLGYNPLYVETLAGPRLRALILHEVEHCARGHPWRRGGREPKRFNMAADISINPDLKAAKYQLPDGALFPEQFNLPVGKSAEWYFDRLPAPSQDESDAWLQDGDAAVEQDQDVAGDGSAPEDSDGEKDGAGDPVGNEDEDGDEQEQDEAGDSAGGADEQDPDAEDETKGEPDPQDYGDPLGDVRDAPAEAAPDGTPPPTEEEWRQAVQEAVNVAQMQGRNPAGMDRFTRELQRSRVDWRAVTRRFAQEAARADYSWRAPNARYLPAGLYMPALRSEGFGVFGIGVDTSGSIDDVLLAQFEAEVRELIAELKPRRTVVWYCDAGIARTDEFGPDDAVEFHPAGGGGTDFRPVFNAAAELDEPPACIIYLTDLYGTFPEQDHGIPTLWVTAQETAVQVPFGEVVSAS